MLCGDSKALKEYLNEAKDHKVVQEYVNDQNHTCFYMPFNEMLLDKIAKNNLNK